MPAADSRRDRDRDADRTMADSGPRRSRRFGWRRRRTIENQHGVHPDAAPGRPGAGPGGGLGGADGGSGGNSAGTGGSRGAGGSGGAGGSWGAGGSGGTGGGSGQRRADATRPMPVDLSAPISPAPDDRPMAPPGYTLYRPSGVDPTRRLADDDDGPDGDGGR
jgi:hypothetical protein